MRLIDGRQRTGNEVPELETAQDRQHVRHGRPRIAGKAVDDVVISRPQPIGRHLAKYLFRYRAHRRDHLDLLLGNAWVIDHSRRNKPVRVADEDIAGLAVALHSQFHAVFYAHLHDAVDHRHALGGQLIARLHLQLAQDLADGRLPLFFGLLVYFLDVFEAQPGIVGLAVGDLDHARDKSRIVEAHAGAVEVGGKFRLLDKLCGGRIALRTQLIGDLLCSAFFLKELAFCLGRTPFGLRRACGVGQDRVDNCRILDQELLVERDQLEQ